jgi:hypothetical protein
MPVPARDIAAEVNAMARGNSNQSGTVGAAPWSPRSQMRIAQMVGRSFRCGMHAQREQDGIGWSYAWQELAGVAGDGHADGLVNALGRFVESVDRAAHRRIEVLPKGCPGLCRDECLAVSIVAASQLGACPALKACVFALVESVHVDPCIRSAAVFADALRDAGQMLSHDVVCNALALMPPPGGRTRLDA